MDIIIYRYASLWYKISAVRDYNGLEEVDGSQLMEQGTVTDLLHLCIQFGINCFSSFHFHD